MIEIHGDERSGNCLKVKWVCDHLAIPYRWTHVPSGSGATASPAFRALNPAGQIPVVVLADGRRLAQSNAIITYLAAGTDLVPPDPFEHARMLAWMFWEQNTHETVVAVRRAMLLFRGVPEADLPADLLPRGTAALDLMEQTLAGQDWFSGPRFGLADIALLPYTRFAPEGGFDLAPRPAIRGWIGRCERELGLPPGPDRA